MTQKKPNNERWIICSVDTITYPPCPLAVNQSQSQLIIKGYHTKTKKLLHEYGPFDTLGLLEQFASEQGITLGSTHGTKLSIQGE